MDLCIIGGGPVGLEMAVSAIQRKLSVTLIEKVMSIHNHEKEAHQDDSNDTAQPIDECQISFPLQRISRINQDKP